MDRAEVLRVVARRKLVAIVTAVLVLAGGLMFMVLQPRVYESSASVALLPAARNPDTLGAYDAIVTRLLPLYASRVRSRSFLDRVAAQLPEDRLDGKDLQSMVFAKPDPGAAVLKVVARVENDPGRAARLAQAATRQFALELQTSRVVDFEIIDQPRPPDAPVVPRPELIVPASLLLAAFLAIAVALVWDRLLGRIRDLDELKLASGRRVLGDLPFEPRLSGSSAALFVGDPTMAPAEQGLRTIRTVLLAPGGTTPRHQSIVVTSLNPEDGKSTLAANLAVVIAEVGLHVLLVDADLDRPRQHGVFDLPNDRGLSTAVDLRTAVQPTNVPNVSVLTAGPPMERRGEVVQQYVQLVPKLNELAELVIIDSAPLSADADVGLLAALTDGVVLLVRAGSTSAGRLRHALEEFDNLGVPLLGLVLTMNSKHASSYSRYAYWDERLREASGRVRSWSESTRAPSSRGSEESEGSKSAPTG